MPRMYPSTMEDLLMEPRQPSLEDLLRMAASAPAVGSGFDALDRMTNAGRSAVPQMRFTPQEPVLPQRAGLSPAELERLRQRARLLPQAGAASAPWQAAVNASQGRSGVPLSVAAGLPKGVDAAGLAGHFANQQSAHTAGVNAAMPGVRQDVEAEMEAWRRAMAEAQPATMADYDPELQLKLAARERLADRNIASVGKMGTPSDTFKARIAQAQGALQPGYTRTVGGSPVSSLDAIWALGGRKYPGLTPEEQAAKAAREAPGPSIAERLEALVTGEGPGVEGINPAAAGKYMRTKDGRIIRRWSTAADSPAAKQRQKEAVARQAGLRKAMDEKLATRRAEAALGVSLTGATPEARQQAIVEAQQRAVQRRGMSRNERMLADRLEQATSGAGGSGDLFGGMKAYQSAFAQAKGMGISDEGAQRIAERAFEGVMIAADREANQERWRQQPQYIDGVMNLANKYMEADPTIDPVAAIEMGRKAMDAGFAPRDAAGGGVPTTSSAGAQIPQQDKPLSLKQRTSIEESAQKIVESSPALQAIGASQEFSAHDVGSQIMARYHGDKTDAPKFTHDDLRDIRAYIKTREKASPGFFGDSKTRSTAIARALANAPEGADLAQVVIDAISGGAEPTTPTPKRARVTPPPPPARVPSHMPAPKNAHTAPPDYSLSYPRYY